MLVLSAPENPSQRSARDRANHPQSEVWLHVTPLCAPQSITPTRCRFVPYPIYGRSAQPSDDVAHMALQDRRPVQLSAHHRQTSSLTQRVHNHHQPHNVTHCRLGYAEQWPTKPAPPTLLALQAPTLLTYFFVQPFPVLRIQPMAPARRNPSSVVREGRRCTLPTTQSALELPVFTNSIINLSPADKKMM